MASGDNRPVTVFRASLYDSDDSDDDDFRQARARAESAWDQLDDDDELDEVNEADYVAFLGRRATETVEAEVKNYRKSLKLGELLKGCSTEEESKEAKRLFKLRKATKELIESEKAYGEDLARIHLIERQLKERLISEQESSVIFKNIDWLVDLHATLLDKLDKVVPNLDLPYDREALDNIIVRISTIYGDTDFLSVYAPYCANHPAQLATLHTRLSDQSLVTALDEWKNQLPVALPLEAYLLKPIQRVLKYRLLFGEVLKAVLPMDPCYAKVVEICDHFQEVATNTNQMKRQKELKSLLMGEVKVVRGLSLAEKLAAGGFEGDLNDYGELIDTASKVNMVINRELLKKQSKDKARMVFLFSRAMFSCKVYDENRVSPKEIFPLNCIDVHVAGPRILRIVESGDSYIFDGVDAEDWAKHVNAYKVEHPLDASDRSPNFNQARSKTASKKRFQMRRSKKGPNPAAAAARTMVREDGSAAKPSSPTGVRPMSTRSLPMSRDSQRLRNSGSPDFPNEIEKERARLAKLSEETEEQYDGSDGATRHGSRGAPVVLDILADGTVREEGEADKSAVTHGVARKPSQGRIEFNEKLKLRKKGLMSMIWDSDEPTCAADEEVNVESLFNLTHPHITRPQVHFDKYSCRGYLIKRGNFRKNWLKRWFVFSLKSKNLSYYRDDTELYLKGTIPLADVCSTVAAASIAAVNPEIETTSAAQVFHVITLNRTYHLLAPDPETLQAWFFLLEMVRTDKDSVL